MSEQTAVAIPAPEDYFATCIAGAVRAGLKLIGRATIASTEFPMSDTRLVGGTNIPIVLFHRLSTFFFTLPGKAFLLRAVYEETQQAEFEAARKGNTAVDIGCRHPFWNIELLCGTLPGRWDLGSEWLYVGDHFDGAEFHITTVPYQSRMGSNCGPIRCYFRSRLPFDRERDVCDGAYDTLLGSYPYVVTEERFGEAMVSMVEVLAPHLREGKLLRGHSVIGMIPLHEFPTCADSFFHQFSPDLLLEAMSEIPFAWSSPDEIVATVKRHLEIRR